MSRVSQQSGAKHCGESKTREEKHKVRLHQRVRKTRQSDLPPGSKVSSPNIQNPGLQTVASLLEPSIGWNSGLLFNSTMVTDVAVSGKIGQIKSQSKTDVPQKVKKKKWTCRTTRQPNPLSCKVKYKIIMYLRHAPQLKMRITNHSTSCTCTRCATVLASLAAIPLPQELCKTEIWQWKSGNGNRNLEKPLKCG